MSVVLKQLVADHIYNVDPQNTTVSIRWSSLITVTVTAGVARNSAAGPAMYGTRTDNTYFSPIGPRVPVIPMKFLILGVLRADLLAGVRRANAAGALGFSLLLRLGSPFRRRWLGRTRLAG